MAKKWKKVAALAAASVMSVTTLSGLLTACTPKEKPIPDAGLKKGTYRTYTAAMPSDWNEMSYTDNNDTQIMNYIGSSFFEFDFKFDGNKYLEDGNINKDAIVDGEFTVEYSAATDLKDVTRSVDAKWGYTNKQKQDGGYAWEITLRDDLMWDDGTKITSDDFVYSMQQQLSPDFFFTRASTWYNQIDIKNAKNYLYHTTLTTYESLKSQGYKSNAEAIADGKTLYINVWEAWGAEGYVDADGNACPEWLAITDETVYGPEGNISSDETSGKIVYNEYAAAGGYIEVGDPRDSWVAVLVDNTHTDVDTFDQVGLYKSGNNKLVICLNKPIKFLNDEGGLTYLAPYMMNSLPLVHKEKFEANKVDPVSGSNLYTSKYNSSFETTASWGPYKLATFESGNYYKLERNENWFGYKLNQYANQYNVTAIECRKISEDNSRWTAFFGGLIDGIGIDAAHKDDYRNSKYANYSAGDGIFGINMYSGLDKLSKSSHNSGVMAIYEFRKAISLYLDRVDYNATLSLANKTALGLINLSSFYDVENGLSYTTTKESREALLRVYGFTENPDHTWTDGVNNYSDYKDAFDAMNGMNRPLAKQLLEEAYTELTSNAEKYGYNPSKKINLVFGVDEDSSGARRYYDYLVTFFKELTDGTSFEGKIELTFDGSYGNKWADAFRNGEYEIAVGTGFSGSPLDPFNFIGVYCDPTAGLMYAQNWWDPTSDMVSFKLPEVDGFDLSGQEIEMSVYNWYCCINGSAETNNQAKKYNWGAGFVDSKVRLAVLAMLEEYILNKYFCVMTTSQYSASLLAAKFSYIIEDENYFMGYGGMRYIQVEYTDSEWENFVKDHGGDLTNLYKEEE